MLLFKEPTAEKKPTPEAPKPAVTPQKGFPQGTIIVSIYIILCYCSFTFHQNILDAKMTFFFHLKSQLG